MKRFVSAILITACLWNIDNLGSHPQPSLAQTQPTEALSYSFYGKQIPLNLRNDVLAVRFKAIQPRGNKPLYLQLQDDLTTRGIQGRGSTLQPNTNLQVDPLGNQLALVRLPAGVRTSTRLLTNQIQQQPYVEETLPVLNQGESEDRENENLIVLPNEIVISFAPGTSETQKQQVLNEQNLEIIRPLRFSQNRYVARSKSASGTEIITVANQLNQVSGIQSATPNFIQAISDNFVPQTNLINSSREILNPERLLQQRLARLPKPKDTPFSTALLPLLWHLDSTPKRGQLLPRTDIGAIASWQASQGGDGVVVAVIDSLIQWDHQDLANNIYTTDHYPDKLPGEVKGWDFSSSGQGDPDTRLSRNERDIIQPHFRHTFELSCQEMVEEYQKMALLLAQNNPDASACERGNSIKQYFRSKITSEFHGTWVSGVVAAYSPDKSGIVGVAPRAKILPIRVFGLNGAIDSITLIEAIGYAAARDADVINLSLGRLMPHQELNEQILSVLEANPQLVIVASAGNENRSGISFPAAIPQVLSVGATNIQGERSSYSNYGKGLDLVAPGGDISRSLSGGILTTGGTGLSSLWQGITKPDYAWGSTLDPLGNYVQVQGTSFAAPAVSGVVALMKGVNNTLNRERIMDVLEETASYQGLTLTETEQDLYQSYQQARLTEEKLEEIPEFLVFPEPSSAEDYFFGRGLVNAEAAIQAVQ